MHSSYKMSAATLMACVALVGCGGGNSDPVAPPPPAPPPADPLIVIPVTVADSIVSVFNYLTQLSSLTAAAETREPADLSTVVLATSDTDEPTTIP